MALPSSKTGTAPAKENGVALAEANRHAAVTAERE
jgi:hypothetical protein